MGWLVAILLLVAIWPWVKAWYASRQTSLGHALGWAMAAWLSWAWVLMEPLGEAARYLALCLTGCAGVAVLGARRPHVAAWDFVVLGLLAVMLLPLVEGWFLGTPLLGLLRIMFLAGTLLVGIINYLPTRLGFAALMTGVSCGTVMVGIVEKERMPEQVTWFAALALVLLPWVAWGNWSWGQQRGNSLDQRWLNFRDQFGLLWAMRIKEMFNHAARHAGWDIVLTWGGLVGPDVNKVSLEEIEKILTGLLKRFR
jgi:hypothetical protein